jgi:hypothetical protein
MYTVVVIPLTEYLLGEAVDPTEGAETLKTLQDTLTQEVGHEVRWTETLTTEDYEENDIEDYCLWSLRALAAHFEVNGSLAGFTLGDDPSVHPALVTLLEEKKVSQQFPQLLHIADADTAAYAPIDMADIVTLTLGTEGETPPEEDEEDEEDEEQLAIGSLTRLGQELERMRVPLGLPETLDELPDGYVFDADADELAPAKYALMILLDRLQEAVAAKTPMLLTWDEYAEDDETHDHAEGCGCGHDHEPEPEPSPTKA